MVNTPQNRASSLRSIPSFSVILIMIALALIGVSLIPLLNIQYSPTPKTSSLSVSFSYYDASARVIEKEVTSKIEGALGVIAEVDDINAVTWFGGGNITLTFKKGKDMDMARFEVATQIRQIYSALPEGVSYPYISKSQSNRSIDNESHILTYIINADMPPVAIAKFIEEKFNPELAKIEGMESARLSGATPYHLVISYDPDILNAIGIKTSDISAAFSANHNSNIIGTSKVGRESMAITLKSQPEKDVLDIPIKNIDGRVIYLRDLATAQYKEMLPKSYSRINGLNTINLTIFANKDVNTISVAREIKGKMEELKSITPENFSFLVAYDASETLEKEIRKIFLRSILSLVILLLFVLLVSRNFRYLFVIFITIIVNLLIAAIFYYFGNVQIQLYSMAGITISLGIIIDTAIVMVDHYTYYKNRTVFTSVLGALLTTIASLSIIFFLPEESVTQLADFVWVIIINLTISLFVAALFVPALLDKIPLKNRGVANLKRSRKRLIVKSSNLYSKYIKFGRKYRWVYVIVIILAFGLPIHMLPEKLGESKKNNKEELNFFENTYNKTIGSKFYTKNRKIFEAALGGSFRVFAKNLNSSNYYRSPNPRKTLSAVASMPEGCTIHQLNDIMKSMENYLSGFSEIDMYRTNVSSVSNGSINITFKEEFENTGFPIMLKQQVIAKASALGGATWRVYGIDDNNFYNNPISGFKQHSVELTGYNYDKLYSYAEEFRKKLLTSARVKDPEIYGSPYNNPPRTEFFIEYDTEKIASSGLNVNKYFNFLGEQLYDRSLGKVYRDGEMIDIQLVSGKKDEFDLWHIRNDMIDIDSIKTRLTDVGSVEKRVSGNDIYRKNQQYSLYVNYDFVGTYELANRVRKRNVKEFNEILPIGYKANESNNRWWGFKEQAQQAGLIFLVIIIIYGICAIIFESLRVPFVIILMIPIGLIGLFLTFWLGGFPFDQGGFAAIVMLAGIVVNAGIYIISEYRTVMRLSSKMPVTAYITAYNRKIIPTLLTIISTVLGLIPFLFDGPDEVFWFAFAVGVMGGMLFSVLALVFVLPIFMNFNKK